MMKKRRGDFVRVRDRNGHVVKLRFSNMKKRRGDFVRVRDRNGHVVKLRLFSALTTRVRNKLTTCYIHKIEPTTVKTRLRAYFFYNKHCTTLRFENVNKKRKIGFKKIMNKKIKQQNQLID